MFLPRPDERPPDLGIHAHGIAHQLYVGLREPGQGAHHDIATVDLGGAGTGARDHPLQHGARNSIGPEFLEKRYVAASGELYGHTRMFRQVAADTLEIGMHLDAMSA